jgi:fructose-1,6-bisphosphatase/inositol monophosphatase family enzyme
MAEKGHGAFVNNQRIITPDSPGKDILSCLTLGKNHDQRTLALADQHIVRSLGSAALEMCMVAIGALDVYMVGKEYLRVTDIAASTLIIREAGGIVKDVEGNDLDMELSLDYRTSVIAACTEELITCVLPQEKVKN